MNETENEAIDEPKVGAHSQPLPQHSQPLPAQSQPLPQHSQPLPANPQPQPQQAHQRSGHSHKPTSRHGHVSASSHAQVKEKPKIGLYVAIALFCVAVILLGLFFMMPISATVNGKAVPVGGHHTLNDAVLASDIQTKPGNLIALDGTLLKEGEGAKFSAKVNGEPTNDMSCILFNNDAIEIGNGADMTETYTITQEPVNPTGAIDGEGPIRIITTLGSEGLQEVKTGDISGIRIATVLEEPTSHIATRTKVDTGGEKLVALTFDDGPHTAYTSQILDILAENDAKATFFTVGKWISGDNVGVVRRAMSEGHQICTHSYDHAAGAGQAVNLGYMSVDEQVAEILDGYAAIEAATGTEASHVVRVPGGNFGEEVIAAIGPHIKADINWNIDTRDWERPGVAAISGQIMRVSPGSIVLMHDGGGDRSQTVQALRECLPKLAADGYRFVTIDELMQYTQ